MAKHGDIKKFGKDWFMFDDGVWINIQTAINNFEKIEHLVER